VKQKKDIRQCSPVKVVNRKAFRSRKNQTISIAEIITLHSSNAKHVQSTKPGVQSGGRGHLLHLHPPKFSKHCIEILKFVETFKE